MFRKTGLLSIAILLLATPVLADSTQLLFFEAQGVTGYSSERKRVIYYSLTQDEVMQKPSIGFDFLKRLSGEGGDYGALAIQGRLAYNDIGGPSLEPQIYNAFFKYKAGFSDLWIGHNRPALGISSYMDSHALLLLPLGMQGFGYDRDWGIGSYRDFSWGNLALSFTTGTGMPLYTRGNYLASARISLGTLSQDNFNLGFSGAYGKPLETMGYDLMMTEPTKFAMAGADLTYFWNNIENRIEAMVGKRTDQPAYALFWRLGINLMEEGRLKLEVQPMYWKIGDTASTQLYGGISYQLTSDLTLRTMYVYEDEKEEQRVILQLYWYSRL